MDIAGNTMPLNIPPRVPVETMDCDCWRNEGEMVAWGNKIKELNALVKEKKEEVYEINERLARRNDTINEMREIIANLASALSKFINEDL